MVVPRVGDDVRVRHQRYRVRSIDAETFEDGEVQHVVLLENRASGESLELIWELEYGAEVLESGGSLSLGEHNDWDCLRSELQATRWEVALSRGSRCLLSPYAVNSEPKDYQYVPVSRALKSGRVNLLLADDVGLGKTIEAGFIVREFLMRRRIRRVLVICPAHLRDHWRRELGSYFGLGFELVGREQLRRWRRQHGEGVDVWGVFPRLVVSMDYLKREHVLNSFLGSLGSKSESMIRGWFK